MSEPLTMVNVIPSLGFGGTERQGVSIAKQMENYCDSRVMPLSSIQPGQIEYWSLGADKVITTKAELEQLAKSSNKLVVIFHNLIRDIDAGIIEFLNELDCEIYEQSVFSIYDRRLKCDGSFQLSLNAGAKFNSTAPAGHRSFLLPNILATDGVAQAEEVTSKRLRFARVGQPSAAKWSRKYVPIIKKTLALLDCEWVLVGCPDSLSREILESISEEEAARLTLIEKITDREDMFRFLKSVTDFVHISNIGESFGYVLFEAGLAGCRVHTLDAPWTDNSQSEYVEQFSHGYVYLSARKMLVGLLNLDLFSQRGEIDADLIFSLSADHFEAKLVRVLEKHDAPGDVFDISKLQKKRGELLQDLYWAMRRLWYRSGDIVDRIFVYAWRRIWWT